MPPVCHTCHKERKDCTCDVYDFGTVKQATAPAHTPGPWTQGTTLRTSQTKRWSKERWEANERIEKEVIFARFTTLDSGRSRIPVARVIVRGPDWEANARLIAAAPELLEACKEAIKYIQTEVDIEVKDHGVGGMPAMPGTACHLHDMLLSAISKAAAHSSGNPNDETNMQSDAVTYRELRDAIAKAQS